MRRTPRASPLRSELRRLSRLSAPMVITQLSTMLLGVVDTMMVGRLGVAELGAASLGHLWTMSTLILGMGMVLGIDPLVTQAHGRRDPRAVGLALQRGIVVALALSPAVAALWVLTGSALELLGQAPDLCRLAQRYVLVQIPSIPLFLVFWAHRQYLQGRGIVAPAMWVAIAANFANVLFNWALIFGHLGFPALGVTGAGIATALSRLFMFLALLGISLRLRLHEGGWTPWSRAALGVAGLAEVLHYGLPVAIQFALEVWAFQAATLLAGIVGEVALAAHTIVLNLASLSFMMPLGISLGAVTRVGNLIGEGRLRRAQLAAWVALAMGAAVMLLSAAVFVLLRRELPHLYTADPEAVAAAAAILPIAAAFQLFDGTQVVAGGVLRGMGRTRPAAVFNLVGYYVLALPLAWWLAIVRGHGLPGIWWGLSLGLASVASMLALWVWKRGPAALRLELAPRGGERPAPIG